MNWAPIRRQYAPGTGRDPAPSDPAAGAPLHCVVFPDCRCNRWAAFTALARCCQLCLARFCKGSGTLGDARGLFTAGPRSRCLTAAHRLPGADAVDLLPRSGGSQPDCWDLCSAQHGHLLGAHGGFPHTLLWLVSGLQCCSLPRGGGWMVPCTDICSQQLSAGYRCLPVPNT